MRFGIDLDSTLNTLDQAWLKWIQEKHDPTFTFDKWVSWNVHKCTPAGEVVYDYLSEPGMFGTLGIQPGAQDVTRALAEQHELFVVTAYIGLPITCADKYEWIVQHFPHIPPENIVFCNRKHLLDLDVLIDDGPHNFTDFKGIPLLFDAPWNRTYLAQHRVSDWPMVAVWMREKGWL